MMESIDCFFCSIHMTRSHHCVIPAPPTMIMVITMIKCVGIEANTVQPRYYGHQGDRIIEVSVLEKRALYGFRSLRDQVNCP